MSTNEPFTEQVRRDLEKNSQEECSRQFKHWMTDPRTRILTSMVPEAVQEGTLRALLEAAYNAGFTAGQANLAITMLKGILLKADKS